MAKLTDDQVNEYHDIFLLFDTVGDNKIAGAQLGEVLRAMGQNPTESDVRKCLKDRNVRLSFEQFLPILTGISKTRPHNTLEEFTEGFKVFDKEQNGTISSAELRHLLTHLGDKLSDDEVEQLLMGHEDPQGNVNYENFVKAIVGGSGNL